MKWKFFPRAAKKTQGNDKHLVMVVPTLVGGGAERVASVLSCALTRSNLKVTVVVFTLEDQAFTVCGDVIDLNLPARKTKSFGKIFRSMNRSIALWRFMKKTNPDIIISMMESANFPAIIASAMSGKLNILKVCVHTNPKSIESVITRMGMRILYPLAESVVAPTSTVKQAFSELGIHFKNFNVIPNPAEIYISQGQVPYPLDDNRPYILGIGRLEHEKGFDRLIEVLSQMKRLDLCLVILGSGSELEALQKLAVRLGVTHRVLFPGFVHDLEPWFRHAQCFCLTSRSESASMVIVEALGYSCPVVSFDTEYGPREILQDGAAGILVPQGEIQIFADSVDIMLDDVSKREEMIGRGSERFLDFDPDRIAGLWQIERVC